MDLDNLIIEVTRRCNFSCAHCLRGDTQLVDLDPKVSERLFSGLNYVSSITFTGGEPALVPHIIGQVLDAAEKYGVSIENFYIATNGSQASDDFLAVLLRLWMYCDDNGEGENMMSAIEISQSDYHESGQDQEAVNRLMAFRFAHMRTWLKPEQLIAEGRGKEESCYDARKIKPNIWEIDSGWDNEGDIGRICDTVYINVFGDVISDCDFSYESQEKYKDGNILTDSWEEIVEHNGRWENKQRGG